MFSFGILLYSIIEWGLNALGEMDFEFKTMIYCVHTNP